MLLALACLLSGRGSALAAEPAVVPITIGETRLVPFAKGDSRQVNVYLPDGYATGTRRLPVLYYLSSFFEDDRDTLGSHPEQRQIPCRGQRHRDVLVVSVQPR